jgi:hypothetical protein
LLIKNSKSILDFGVKTVLEYEALLIAAGFKKVATKSRLPIGSLKIYSR